MTFQEEHRMLRVKDIKVLLGGGRLTEIAFLMSEMPGYQELGPRRRMVPAWGFRKWQEKKGKK